MINGKRIEAVCVSIGGEVEVCWAPAYSSLFGGTKVEIDGLEGTGTVLFSDTVTIGKDEYSSILEHFGEPRRILRKLYFDNMKWEEEEADDKNC